MRQQEDHSWTWLRWLLAVWLLLVSVKLQAQSLPMSYSGRLVDASGIPVDGPLDLEFSFYRSADGGSPILDQPYRAMGVILDSGVFQHTLDLDPADTWKLMPDTETPLFIEVTDITHGKVYPRQRFTAVPFAARVPVDGSSINFDASGRLAVIPKPASANAPGLIKATSSFIDVDSNGDITAIKQAATAATANNFTGILTGDVSGTQAMTVVTKILGKPISGALDASNDQKVLKWNHSSQSFELSNDLSSGGLNPNDVTSVVIQDGSVNNADISATAAIVDSKLAPITTPGKVSGSAIDSGTIAGSAVFAGSGGVDTAGPISGAGPITGSGNIILGASGINRSELRFQDSDNSHYVGFKAPATVTTSLVWTLPSSSGSSGQLLQLDANGTLSWASLNLGNWDSAYSERNQWDGSTVSDPVAGRLSLGLAALATLSGVAGGDGGTISDDSITNADIKTNAGIATTKLSGALTAIAGHGLGALATKTSVDLSGVDTTGTLPIGSGGTGATSFTANSVLLGNGVSALQGVAPGELGHVLTSDGNTWISSALPAVLWSESGGDINRSSGNVGIGTTNPSAKIEVGGIGGFNSGSYPIDTPSLWVGDAQYGMNSQSSTLRLIATENTWGKIAFRTQSGGVFSDKLTIANNGYVGIGATNPTTNLDVNGQIKIQGGTPGTGKVLTSDTDGLATWQTPTISSSNISDGSITMADIGDSAVNSAKITDDTIIDADIATNAAIADTKLGTITTAGKVSGNAITAGTISGNVAVSTTGPITTTNNLVVSGGNVGIGTTSPSARLDVAGGGMFTNTLYVNNNRTGTGSGSTGTIQLGDGTLSKTYGSAFSLNSGLYTQGSIGIGIASPTSPLHMHGNNTTNEPQGAMIMTRWYQHGSWMAGSSIFHWEDTTDLYDRLSFAVTGYGGIDWSNPNQLRHIKMTIMSDGRVGINTVRPVGKLNIGPDGPVAAPTSWPNAQNNEGLAIYASHDNSPYLGTVDLVALRWSDASNGGSQFRFWTQGRTTSGPSVRMVINKDGNVGIGTTSPSATLEVVGQVVSKLPATSTPTGTTQTIDFANGNVQVLDLSSATGNVTLTLANPVAGGSYAIKTIQGATARTLTWPATVKWPGGSVASLSTTNGAIDLITLVYDGTNYLAVGGNNFQ